MKAITKINSLIVLIVLLNAVLLTSSCKKGRWEGTATAEGQVIDEATRSSIPDAHCSSTLTAV
ncbi:MAG TPA: hypothetical protein VF691_22645 [Cytophagaceae bacterium]|jgi:ABC-type cobalt transport system substrate-binding protein